MQPRRHYSLSRKPEWDGQKAISLIGRREVMRSCPLTVSEGDGEARGKWPGSSWSPASPALLFWENRWGGRGAFC